VKRGASLLLSRKGKGEGKTLKRRIDSSLANTADGKEEGKKKGGEEHYLVQREGDELGKGGLYLLLIFRGGKRGGSNSKIRKEERGGFQGYFSIFPGKEG